MHKIKKITFLLTLTALLTIYLIPKAAAQDNSLYNLYSFSFTNNHIQEILDSIRLKTSLGVSYNPDFLPNEKIYSGSFHNIPINVILDSVFTHYNLFYQLVGTTIAISVKPEIPNPQIPTFETETDTLPSIRLTGKITDADNHEPLAYTNIFIKGSSIGTISNTDGNFVVTIPHTFRSDTLSFSFLGYKTSLFLVSELKSAGNSIELQPHTIELKEVVVKSVIAEKIIRNSIENIPQNYSLKPQLLTAFYRETLRQNGRYVVLSEAVLKIYKATYNNYQNDQVTVFKGRKIPLSDIMDTICFKLQGGIYNSLMIDIAKNHSNFMSGENFELYEYKFDEIVSVQGHLAYVILFDQKDGVQYPLYKGKLYIDTESLAIIKAEFNLSPKGIIYAAQMMVQKSPPGVKVKPTDAYYLVNYTERNNKWYLSNIREDVKFKVRKRFNFFNITFHSVVELAITNADSTNVKRFKYSEIIKTNDVFTDKITQYDPSFWGKFNYIPPDISIEEAIIEIKEKMVKVME